MSKQSTALDLADSLESELRRLREENKSLHELLDHASKKIMNNKKEQSLKEMNQVLFEALDYVISDLEMRSELKSGRSFGLVDIGNGAYLQAKAALAKAQGEKE